MKRYIAMAAVAMMFAACTNDDMPTPEVDAMTNKPVMVNVGVAELITRTGMTSDDLATLGLTINNEAKSLYSYNNVKFVKEGNSTKFIPAEGEVTPLWQNATQEVFVSVWSPYVEDDITNGYAFSVQSNQTTLEATQASDFLMVCETVDPDVVQTGKIRYNASNGGLEINLQHTMSKLVMNCRYGTDLSDVIISNIVVKNIENACRVNLQAGTIQAPTTSVKKDIFAYKAENAKSGYDVTYEVIFPPHKSAFTVMIELSDGRKFLHENVEYDFLSDYQYDLDLKIGKDKVELASGNNGITSAPWRKDTESDKYFETE